MSGTARTTARNTALLTVFEIANPFISLVLIGAMSRRLGAGGLGAYNLLLTFYFVAHAFTTLGLNTFVTREVSRDRSSAGRFLAAAAYVGSAVSACVGVGVILILRVAGYGSEVQDSAWLVCLCLFPSIAILAMESVFIAHEKIHLIVRLALIENIGRTLAGLWLLREGHGVGSLMASFVAFRFVTLGLGLAAFRKHVAPLAWRADSGTIRALIGSIPVFGGILIASTLYSRADVFLLSKMVSLEAVGYYTAAYRLFAIAQVLPKSFNTALYPVLSRKFVASPESYEKANGLAIKYVLVALLPVSAGIFGLAEPVIRLLYGGAFGPAVPVLKVLIWTLVPYGVARVLASALFASNRQTVDLKVNALALAANIALNLALIPRLGILGSAWAALFSMGVFLLLQALHLRREIVPIVRQAAILRPAAATVAILLWLFLTPSVHMAVRVAGGVLIYAVSLAWLRVVRVADLRKVLPERFAEAWERGVES